MSVRVLIGNALDVLKTLPAESVHCAVTSPPYYGLRAYLPDEHADKHYEIGLEPSPNEFVAALVGVFREVKRVLRKDATLWLNIGDSYTGSAKSGGVGSSNLNEPGASFVARMAQLPTKSGRGLKPKDLIGIPWMLAFALRADGWYLRQDIIWSKPNPMPESVTDRCTKAHEYIFLLAKSQRYHYDTEAIAEESAYPGDERHLRTDRTIEFARPDGGSRARTANPTGLYRNKRSVWAVAGAPFGDAHFATFPPALIEPCIKAGCPEGGTVLDPFGGAGTTGLVADRLGRNAILIELNPEYAAMAQRRIEGDAPLFAVVACGPEDTYDPVADSIGSHIAALQEVGRRVASGEEDPPTTGYFASKAGGAR